MMSKFEMMLKQRLEDKSHQEIVIDMICRFPGFPKEKRVVAEILDECKKLSESVKIVMLLFAQAGNNDEDRDVYAKRCEVLEYLTMVNYGISEYFKNIQPPEVKKDGN